MVRFLSLALAVLAILVYKALQRYLALRKQIAIAKTTGIPYVVVPFFHIGNFWVGAQAILLPLYEKIPGVKNRMTTKLLRAYNQWHYLREPAEQLGEIFMMVSPYGFYLCSSSAEFNSAVAARKSDFLKPVQMYDVAEIFGKNMLTCEGEDWKRHRKIVGPSFSEKSNALVFEESVRQARAMLDFFAKKEANSEDDMRILDVAPYTANLALHVICGAGFGVPQTWPGEDESVLGTRVVPGFNTKRLNENHKLTFKHTLDLLQECFVWVAVLPMWLIKRIPTKLHKEIYAAYLELAAYFDELVEYKTQKLEMGEKDVGTMDLLAPLISSLDSSADFDNQSPAAKAGSLSLSEITGNAFIFLFAGHETAANTLHFCLLFLAMYPVSQRALQADIDRIVGKSEPSTWTYTNMMGRLYKSMVGAVMNEELRLLPPLVALPKITRMQREGGQMQSVSVDGVTKLVPPGTFMHMNVVGTARNPRYFPHQTSRISGKNDDMDDFVPERWLMGSPYHAGSVAGIPANDGSAQKEARDEEVQGQSAADKPDGLESVSFDNASTLFRPVKGSFLPFSEGPRGCPGKRFAQVEITAVLATVFREYSVELDVGEWASDGEVEGMGREERGEVYGNAVRKAEQTIRGAGIIVTLKLLGGSRVPIRFVKKGRERFWDVGETR